MTENWKTDMRILIVDNDATSRLMLKSMGTKLGHECRIANDESSASELLSHAQYDVLLTDWTMPGLDGPNLCRMVRELPANNNYVYIVLITSLDRPEQILEGMSAGADDYLIKPVDPFTVYARLIAADSVTALRRQIADSQIQLELANMELRFQSLSDALTGLGNRRAMEEELHRLHARAIRRASSYGVVLFDIDHFKLYNDNFGQVAGDAALRDVARCLHATVRAGESIYRYGGKEFSLLIPECDVAALIVAAERARRAVLGAALPHNARPTEPPWLTLSAGVSHRTAGSALSPSDLIQQAHTALNAAKSAGRNRVHVAA